MNFCKLPDNTDFYPNECYVCHKTRDLKRCSRCQMISYCGSLHQKEHWSKHKDLCTLISTMMKERGVSHLFEKLRGVDLPTWKIERISTIQHVELRLGRSLAMKERLMFIFPRCCFVCYESRQNLLANCPGCPSASFCKEHPSSSIHDRDCAIMKAYHQRTIAPDWPLDFIYAASSLVQNTRVSKYSKLPSSLREYLCEFAKLERKVSEYTILYISEIFSIPLTIFNSLQKIGLHSVSQLTIHIGNMEIPIKITEPWETLLHLFPDLKVLRILIVDYDYKMDFDSEITFKLCSKCRSYNRKLTVDCLDFPYLEYMARRDYERPDILVYLNKVTPEENEEEEFYEEWIELLNGWSKLNCPIILTSFRDKENALLLKSLRSLYLGKFEICFNGYNPFASLAHNRVWEDGGVKLSNQFLTIIKSQDGQSQQCSNVKLASEKRNKVCANHEKDSMKDEKSQRKCFYATVCFVCHSSNTSVTCKRCKMIFYCGKAHQDEHLPKHKDLCKVILKMLNESGAPNLFDKLKTTNSESWLKAKVDLMTKAQLKLGRKLLDYEEEMFLCPKTCFVCHESDLSVLRNCGCGVTLCKTHKKDPSHKGLCRDLSLAFKLAISEQSRISKVTIKASSKKEYDKLPATMVAFMDSSINLKKQTELHVPDSEKILISDFLTRPLTVLWCLQKLAFKINSSMVIHVIGATNSEISAQEYWKIILYWLQNLKTLTLVFVGPKIVELKPSDLESQLEFPKSALAGKTLKVESHDLKYEEYFKSESFLQPNIIVGYNLHMHESEIRVSDYNWNETVLTLKKIDAPFILTAGSEERAQKDHEKFCQHLGKAVDYVFCDRNPYGGLIPERDFETERLMYSNQFVIIYNKLFENVLSKRNQVTAGNFGCEIKLTKAVESVTESEITENSNCKDGSKLADKPLKGNSLLTKKNKLREENISLKKENKEFLKNIQRLKLENEQLIKENRCSEETEFKMFRSDYINIRHHSI